MTSTLFSTYSSGENRITSTTLAVLQRIDLALVQALLAASSGLGADLRGVTFENQVASKRSVPDGRISGRFDWWFETKTVLGAYSTEGHSREQLRRHAQLLVSEADALLFVLTPDSTAPAWFGVLDGIPEAARARIAWLSFRDIAETIDTLLREPARTIGHRSRFLLEELVAFFDAEGLLSNDDVVVVAAGTAWPEYLSMSAYVCQPDKPFRDGLTRLGFYTKGEIKPSFPTIRARRPSVLFTAEEAEARRTAGEPDLAAVIDAALAAGTRTPGNSYGVVLLSEANSPDTLTLPQPVANDTMTAQGKPYAYTAGQRRYTSTAKLQAAPTVTSQL